MIGFQEVARAFAGGCDTADRYIFDVDGRISYGAEHYDEFVWSESVVGCEDHVLKAVTVRRCTLGLDG